MSKMRPCASANPPETVFSGFRQPRPTIDRDRLRNFPAPMPYLAHPPLQRLIATLPVDDHSTEVAAQPWREPCVRAGQAGLHDAMFAGRTAIRIPRGWLRQPDAPPELRVFGALLSGRPRPGVHPWLARLPAITAAALAPASSWDEYSHRLAAAGLAGLAATSRLAHFLGHELDGRPALIVDARIRRVCGGQRWTELAELRELAGPTAARRYPDYVRLLHAIAAAGGYRADQLEFFLAELGDAF
jgi:hypothetical protein